jgi:hypothetical protein
VFDRVRTCDNHCEFCFIYQLPKGLRRSLYLKDDDYRLSFLYGNFTTLTRFTEAGPRAGRHRAAVAAERQHPRDRPELRSRMLSNPRGGMSLRWLRALLDHGIAVRGRSSSARASTTARRSTGRSPTSSTSTRARVRRGRAARASASSTRSRRCGCTHPDEAAAVVDAVEDWQDVFLRCSVGGWSSPPTSTTS